METSAKRLESFFLSTNGYIWMVWHTMVDTGKKAIPDYPYQMSDLDGNSLFVYFSPFATKEQALGHIKSYLELLSSLDEKTEIWDLSQMPEYLPESDIARIEYEQYIADLPYGKDNCLNSFDVIEYDGIWVTYPCQRKAVTSVGFVTKDHETGLTVMTRMKVCETCRQVITGEPVTS